MAKGQMRSNKEKKKPKLPRTVRRQTRHLVHEPIRQEALEVLPPQGSAATVPKSESVRSRPPRVIFLGALRIALGSIDLR
jgi:hypothetical protein